MSNNFEENNKIFSAEGIINRRNFFANYLVSILVGLVVFSTPIFYLTMFNTEMMSKIMQAALSNPTSSEFPLWFVIWGIVGFIIRLCVLTPSIIKRVRDITEKEDVTLIVSIILVLMLLGNIPCKFPIVSQIFLGINFFIILCLMFTKGKITSEKPVDNVVKFNWGAMFGTWIWGLINKSYVTLWAIPLFFTCGGFFVFALICGLKGNEWAYAKQKDKSLEDFHKSQTVQTAWFSACVPIVVLVVSIISVLFGSVMLYQYFQKNPNALKSMENYSSRMITSSVEARYDNIELTDNEYKFYISPTVWNGLPAKAKKNLFVTTESYVFVKLTEDNKISKKELSSNDKYLAESNKIKIYSSFNNELLAERNVDVENYKKLEEQYKKKEIPMRALLEVTNGGYSFNEHPTLP